ncbi:MAG: pknB 13 [Planctomycetaceae bacterium]|nr:pknB 13 [Planctomycetaceae bacterium]
MKLLNPVRFMNICLAPDRLRAFRRGEIENDADVELISEHLANCPQCQDCFEACEDSPLGVFLEFPEAGSESTLQPDSPTSLVTPDWQDFPPPHALTNHPKWECLSVLGKGGMGVVYLARHRLLQDQNGLARLRALKILQVSLAAGKEYSDRFFREIQIVTQLPEHPHIVRAYDVERLGDYFMLEMEYVPGQNLEEFAKSCRSDANKLGRIPFDKACGFILQALSGLDLAARHGIVHRDLKPENLMLTPDLAVKILDFGLAKVRSPDTDSTQLTRAGIQGCGSPKYLSPEQSVDFANTDIRSDLYALGCTLYRLIAGHPPFCEQTGHTEISQILTAHKTRRPPLLSNLCPEVPRQLSEVVAQLLEKRPDMRFAAATTAAEALFPFAEESAQRRTREWLQSSLPESTVVPIQKRRARRWIAPLAVSATVLLLLFVYRDKVLQVRTKAGTVELELDDENVELRIDDRAVDKTRIKIRTRGEKTWLVIEAERGQHELRVSKPGFAVFSENVEVQVGKSAPVRVRLIPVEPITEQPMIPKLTYQPLLDADYAQKWDLKGPIVTSLTYEKGALTTRNTGPENYEDHLVTKNKDLQNFRLKFEVNITDPLHPAVIMFRVDPSPMVFGGMRGYQVVIQPKNGNQPGSVKLELGNRARGNLLLKQTNGISAACGRWLPIEVIVEDSLIRIEFEGQPVLEYSDSGPTFLSGAVALRFLSGAVAEYRNIAIHELPATMPSDKRVRWVYRKEGGNEWNETWGIFTQSSEKKWYETVTFPNQFNRFEFTEVNRNADFIELQRTTTEGQYFFRIFADHADMGPTLENLKEIYRGSWGVTSPDLIPPKNSGPK